MSHIRLHVKVQVHVKSPNQKSLDSKPMKACHKSLSLMSLNAPFATMISFSTVPLNLHLPL